MIHSLAASSPNNKLTMDIAEVYYEEHKSLLAPINETIAKGDSAIQKFYEGTSVFVTGGTGFLGKQLIEKLLRACNIKRIYVLMRSKKGISTKERLANLTKELVYDELKKHLPNFAEKILPIEGDVSELRLGINENDWNTLAQEVNIIFHAAATTKFDEQLRTATLINVRGTREALTLARSCKNLKSFVHVSTAYSHATENKISKDVLEQFYPCPVQPDTLIKLAVEVDGDKLNAITSEFIRDWPNTYTFSKAVAEELVRTTGEGLPICIVRPPIVISSYAEPVSGWTDKTNMNGPSGILLGMILGVFHVILTDHKRIDVFPVDYVNNTLIASAWDTAHRDCEDVKIYTVYNENSFSLGEVGGFLRDPDLRRFASPKSIWYGFVVEVKNKLLFWILTWLFHYIPAYIVNSACYVLNIKMPKEIPSLLKIYEKAYKQTLVYGYYTLNEWNFTNRNAVDMFNRLSQADKIIFNFDTSAIDWKRIVGIWCLGLRLFMIKDGLKGSAYGFKKQKVFKILTYLLLCVYILVAWFMLSVITKFIINLFK